MGHPFLFAGEWRCITDFLIFQETSLCLSPLTERAVFSLSRNQERRNTSSTQKGPSGDYHKYCWYFLAYMQHKVISCPSDSLGQVLWSMALLHTVIHGLAPSILWHHHHHPGLCHHIHSGGTRGTLHIHTSLTIAHLQGRWPVEESRTQGPCEG